MYSNAAEGRVAVHPDVSGINYEPSGGPCGTKKLETNGTYEGEAEVEQEGGTSEVRLHPLACEEATYLFCLAVEEPGGGGELLETTTTSVKFLGSKESGSSLSLNSPALGVKIECEKAQDEGAAEPAGASNGLRLSKLVIKFESNCRDVDNEADCEVKEPFTTHEIEGTLSLECLTK
jgi:hypothetical protein